MLHRELTHEEQSKVREIITDPIQFVNRLLSIDVWSEQIWILEALLKHSRIAVKACHASGKTFAAALAVLWWITRYKDGIAVTTAPTWLQVEKLIWGEVHKAVERGQIAFPPVKVAELYLGPGNYAIGLSTVESERFQGFHEGHVLIIMDEAPGVRPPIYAAVEGIRAGGIVKVLALGNPVLASGEFYEAFTSQRSTWATRTISAFHTPNLAPLWDNDIDYINEVNDGNHDDILMEPLLKLGEKKLDENVRSYLTTRRWVKEKWFEWGLTKSPLWDARVMGRFPRQGIDFLIPLNWAEMASFREVKPRIAPDALIEVGIDVAGPGEDETVVYVRKGKSIIDFQSWAMADPRGEVVAMLNKYKSHRPRVKVDSLGLGHYFVEHIRDCGFDVVGVNIQSTDVRDSMKYADQKAEHYWHLRETFETGMIDGLTDQETIAQLTSIKYDHDSKGCIKIESKKRMKKRGVRSPDRAEALMLAFAEVNVSGEVGFV